MTENGKTKAADAETLAAYEAQAERYAGMADEMSKDPLLDAFIAQMPEGGHVLDLGCGPGWAAAKMTAAGLRVLATDVSPEMIRRAGTIDGVEARLAGFHEIAGEDVHDGIWANFSLLHAAREDMPDHLAALHRALKPGGVLHVALKTGTGAHRDSLGRYYTYYTEEELTGLLRAAGFTPVSTTKGCGKGLAGTDEPWIAISAHG